MPISVGQICVSLSHSHSFFTSRNLWVMGGLVANRLARLTHVRRILIFAVVFIHFALAISLKAQSPQISSLSPTTGRAGDQITISGSAFGSVQGTGKVWLGNTYGVVVSWTDTQVVATIASGAQSGTGKVLQGGVWSNAVNLTVITPNISSVTPAGSDSFSILKGIKRTVPRKDRLVCAYLFALQ
jgi:hypothetical protein